LNKLAAGALALILTATAGPSLPISAAQFTQTITIIGTPAPTSGPTISVAPATINPGDTVTVSVTGGPGNRTDWIGLSTSGATDEHVVAWRYFNGAWPQTAPDTGSTSTVIQIPAPSDPGNYEARLYCCDGYMVLARKPFSVGGTTQPPPPPPPPPPPVLVPVITVTPDHPAIPDTSKPGASVAVVTVAMSDGTAFTGSIRFAAPNFDAAGMFALSGNSIILNPTGPGVGPDTPLQHITLEALP